MKNLIFIMLLFMMSLFTSCDRVANFELTNSSNKNISNLQISIYAESVNGGSINLKKGESSSYKLDLSKTKGDGQYYILYSFNGSNKLNSETFGYFTSKTPSEDLIKLSIFDDTITYQHIR